MHGRTPDWSHSRRINSISIRLPEVIVCRFVDNSPVSEEHNYPLLCLTESSPRKPEWSPCDCTALDIIVYHAGKSFPIHDWQLHVHRITAAHAIVGSCPHKLKPCEFPFFSGFRVYGFDILYIVTLKPSSWRPYVEVTSEWFGTYCATAYACQYTSCDYYLPSLP